jgi:hypothetical protein
MTKELKQPENARSPSDAESGLPAAVQQQRQLLHLHWTLIVLVVFMLIVNICLGYGEYSIQYSLYR